MMGARIFCEADFHETKHNQQFDMHFQGDIQGNLALRFKPLDEGILLEVKLDFITPPLLKKHPEDAILHENERAVEHMLKTLKTLLDTNHARTLNRV